MAGSLYLAPIVITGNLSRKQHIVSYSVTPTPIWLQNWQGRTKPWLSQRQKKEFESWAMTSQRFIDHNGEKNNNSFIWHQLFTLHHLLKSTHCAVSPLNHRSPPLWYWIISGIKSTHGCARPKNLTWIIHNHLPWISALNKTQKTEEVRSEFILAAVTCQQPPPRTSTLHGSNGWQKDNCNSPHTQTLI